MEMALQQWLQGDRCCHVTTCALEMLVKCASQLVAQRARQQQARTMEMPLQCQWQLQGDPWRQVVAHTMETMLQS